MEDDVGGELDESSGAEGEEDEDSADEREVQAEAALDAQKAENEHSREQRYSLDFLWSSKPKQTRGTKRLPSAGVGAKIANVREGGGG